MKIAVITAVLLAAIPLAGDVADVETAQEGRTLYRLQADAFVPADRLERLAQ